MHIVVHDTLSGVNPDQWNALVTANNPFMRYEFLHGLEASGCTTIDNGWEPCHIAIYAESDRQQLLGAMPCYIKSHSYGEYIFDWSWADAYHRNGMDYYPKLSSAVPFTPATGPRWLVADTTDDTITDALLETAKNLVKEKQLSSFHSLFLTPEQASKAKLEGFSQRSSSQFHWQNRGYSSFDDFLAQMTSKKRKNIKRERRRVHEQAVEYRWLTGDELNETAVTQMAGFYLRTIRYYGAQAYLNRAFFDYLAEHFNSQTLFLFAYYQDQPIAGGLYFCSDDTLYGRYWGALNNFHSVHFETCYYQAIDWCIRHNYQRFEAGAQGEHKLARGLEPNTTYSVHWMENPQFRSAIDEFLENEADHIKRYQGSLNSHSPFKREL